MIEEEKEKKDIHFKVIEDEERKKIQHIFYAIIFWRLAVV